MDGHDARAIERGVSDFAQQPNAGLTRPLQSRRIDLSRT